MTKTRRLARRTSICTSLKPAAFSSPASRSAWSRVRPWAAWPCARGLTRRSARKIRPPGASTRRASASPAARSVQWWTELRAQVTVALASGRGRASAVPLTNVTFGMCRAAVSHRPRRSIMGAGSTPVALAHRSAAARAAVPGPQPMSTTWSPDVSLARSAIARAAGPRPTVIDKAVRAWYAIFAAWGRTAAAGGVPETGMVFSLLVGQRFEGIFAARRGGPGRRPRGCRRRTRRRAGWRGSSRGWRTRCPRRTACGR